MKRDCISNKCLRLKILYSYFRYQAFLSLKKKKQNQLGLIKYNIKNVTLNGYVVSEEIQINYIRQDNTDEAGISFDSWDAYFSWRWDFVHLVALLLMLKLLLNYIKIWVFSNLSQPLSWIFYKPIYAKYLTKILITSIYSINSTTFLKQWVAYHNFFVDVLVDLCSFFNIFF